MILDLHQHDVCDDGEALVVTLRAGRVAATIDVQDGIFGQKVVVVANLDNGEFQRLEMDLSCES